MKALIILICLSVQSVVFAQAENKTTGKDLALHDDSLSTKPESSLNFIKPKSILKLEIPKTGSNELVITHAAYSFVYNETHEQAQWVAYELTKKETNNLFERTDKFLLDPEVKTGTACDKDYLGSGYDRGHLAPAADMGWSEITVAESFYYSNMSPQEPSFNRGIWKKTEELVREWAIENNSIYIVTGPLLSKGLKTIGKNKVSVPKYYYKVVLDYSDPGVKGIGFIMPNTASKNDPRTFAVSIDSIEKLSGIDFYPGLPDDQETVIEKTLCIDCWTWNSSKSSVETEKHEPAVKEERSTAVQCSGKTQAKKRCKHKTKSPNGLCSQHGGD
ncbi:MAG: non-specific endonuclease [Fluviicola sp.]|jgi:endonuclease G|uniref:DNA/RNA non-specific endonuclease n=1 Tax=Fluviicola sp. TaxID=1917219 RepID=UPI0026302356|nr:DNA/RNA non-specific endonuclease [Fluviicola sp.]MDF3027095.1 non-specific endonuclease [Fluviicola sp.]